MVAAAAPDEALASDGNRLYGDIFYGKHGYNIALKGGYFYIGEERRGGFHFDGIKPGGYIWLTGHRSAGRTIVPDANKYFPAAGIGHGDQCFYNGIAERFLEFNMGGFACGYQFFKFGRGHFR